MTEQYGNKWLHKLNVSQDKPILMHHCWNIEMIFSLLVVMATYRRSNCKSKPIDLIVYLAGIAQNCNGYQRETLMNVSCYVTILFFFHLLHITSHCISIICEWLWWYWEKEKKERKPNILGMQANAVMCPFRTWCTKWDQLLCEFSQLKVFMSAKHS